MPNKTEHIKLNQWEPEDKFLRTDFNEDNAALETALTALQTAVAECPRLAWGQYTGTGYADSGTSKYIELGYRPKGVLIIGQGPSDTYRHYELKFDDHSSPGSIVFSDTGMTVYNNSGALLNYKNRVYTYLVIL